MESQRHENECNERMKQEKKNSKYEKEIIKEKQKTTRVRISRHHPSHSICNAKGQVILYTVQHTISSARCYLTALYGEFFFSLSFSPPLAYASSHLNIYPVRVYVAQCVNALSCHFPPHSICFLDQEFFLNKKWHVLCYWAQRSRRVSTGCASVSFFECVNYCTVTTGPSKSISLFLYAVCIEQREENSLAVVYGRLDGFQPINPRFFGLRGTR